MSDASSSRYTPAAVALHWILAALIIFNLAYGLYTVDLPLSPQKLTLFSYHKWVGITVLAIAAGRLLWRLGHPPPPLPDTMKPWEKRLAHASHTLLYVLFFAAPLTGWLFSSAAGFQTVYLGVLPIPDLLAKNKELADVLKVMHHWINYTMAAVIVLHVAAALKHHFIDRDDVLTRMLPFLPEGHDMKSMLMSIRVSCSVAFAATSRCGAAEDHPGEEPDPLRHEADERAGRGRVQEVRRERRVRSGEAGGDEGRVRGGPRLDRPRQRRRRDGSQAQALAQRRRVSRRRSSSPPR